jgi:hypothetical protein
VYFKKIIKSLLLSGLTIVLISCVGGSGGSNQPNPPAPPAPKDLPNPFDNSSVKDIKFETRNLDDTLLPYIDLTKVGSHIDYKITITNPNKFNMLLANIQFEKNYYFAKNDKPDNCFNKSWYSQNAELGVYLNMPSNSNCSLYTTSIWYENYSRDTKFSDTVNYKIINNNDWGYTVSKDKRQDIWCKSECLSSKTVTELPELANQIYHHIENLNPIADSSINALPITSFSLNGEYIVDGYVTGEVHDFGMERKKVVFDKDQNAFKILDTKIRHQQRPSGSQMFLELMVNRDGADALGRFIVTGTPRGENAYYAKFENSSPYLTMPDIYGHEFSFAIGLDNKVWLNDSARMPRYNINPTDDYLSDWSAISPNLDGIVTDVVYSDLENNIITKKDDRLSCYTAGKSYKDPLIADIGVRVNSKIISNTHIYANTSASEDLKKYYDFSQNEISFPVTYEFDAASCTLTNKFFVKTGSDMVITDKFTAVKTDKGYAIVNLN